MTDTPKSTVITSIGSLVPRANAAVSEGCTNRAPVAVGPGCFDWQFPGLPGEPPEAVLGGRPDRDRLPAGSLP